MIRYDIPAMLRVILLLLVASALSAVPAFAYTPANPAGETRPHDAKLPHSAVVKLPEEGLDFVAEQLRGGLQASSLRRAITEALEGQFFEVILPIFGGTLKLTIPCGKSNQFKADDYADRLWCPYVRGESVRDGQGSLPELTTLDDGFRYEKVVVKASTYPIAGLALPEPHSLFASLELLEQSGKRAQLDMVPEHPMFKFVVPDPATLLSPNPQYLCFNLLGDGVGTDNDCKPTFVATLEAELITGGQLRPYFEDNVLYVLVNNFDTRLTGLEVLTPLTDAGNSGLISALNQCIAANVPGISEVCQGQLEQALVLLDTVEKALGDAAIDFFERELNAALSDVLEDGINQLMFDREKDGTPDPVLDIKALAGGLTDYSGKQFNFNFETRYLATPTDPVQAFFLLDGGIFTERFDPCIGVDAEPRFDYTELEADGNSGHDPPQLGSVIPGTSKSYQIGASFSDDFVNQLVYNVWASGLFCVTVNPASGDVPDELAELLVTDTFAPFAPWLPEFAPHAPVSLQVVPREAPRVSFGDVGDGSLLRIHANDILLNVFVQVGESEKRFIRAFGIAANITAAVDVNGINFNAAPLIDLSVDFESTSSVAFNDLNPAENEAVAALLAPVLSVMAPAISDLVGNLEVPLINDCLGGLEQQDLVMRTLGTDPLTRADNYLALYLNFTGSLDFDKIINQCLTVFEEFAAPRRVDFRMSPLLPVDLGLLTSVRDIDRTLAASVNSEIPHRVRLDGGLWSLPKTGSPVPMPMLDGSHRLEVEQGNAFKRFRFELDRAAPVLRFEQAEAAVTMRAVDLQPVEMRLNGGSWVKTDKWTSRLSPGRHRLTFEARDAAGHVSSVEKSVVVKESRWGCATGGPVGGFGFLLLVILASWRLRRRRGFSIDS